MYNKIIFNDFSDIEDDILFEKLNNGKIKIESIIDSEIENLKSNGVKFVDEKKLIVESFNNEINQLILPYQLEECDINGILINTKKHNQNNNLDNIKSVKSKIISKYLIEKGCKNLKTLYNGNIISFLLPNDKHSENHSYINSFNMEVKSFSESDRQDLNWIQTTNKYTKDLLELWKKSKEKKKLCYWYNSEYLDNIIKNNFPHIIKQKKTNVLFVYDDNDKHYHEIIENKDQSELTKYIQESMFNDNNDLLSLRQLAEVKTYLINTFEFPIKNFESSNLINCKNGVVNIITGNLMKHSHEYFFNYIIDIDYNKNANSKKLDKFITNVVTENEPLILIKKILGFIHYSGKKLEKGILFHGTKKGRNGKGTLVELINKIIPNNVTIRADQLQDNTTFSTYKLKDKALFVIDDYKLDFMSSKLVGLFNTMISKKEDQAQQKGKQIVDFIHTATPLIQCNKLPRIKGEDDGGFYARWLIVHFNNEYGHYSKTNEFLAEQLLNDNDVMSSMLNYLIEGYQIYLDRKNSQTKGDYFKNDSDKVINDWKISNNSALQFVDECCQLGSNYKIPSRDLWEFYFNEWNRGSSKFGEKKFISMLKEEYNLITDRLVVDNIRKSYIIGITCDELLESNKFSEVKGGF